MIDDDWNFNISQHLTTKPLAFFHFQAFYSKDYQEAEVHLMCFASGLFSHWTGTA